MFGKGEAGGGVRAAETEELTRVHQICTQCDL